ncbi:hypothetical protein HK57_00051 [Aspergillus ustus]|uniref:Uncharacterized protein n=1 Tax=Aspergillus ustus TaxID=40382 RepID=A0A0C1E1M4_ASPUT|nr:hypothetical protein HK57_00051 [Aspergillus ustus]
MSLFRSGRTAAVQLRGFSTSSALRVGPESPNFIEIPQPIQPYQPAKRSVKGVLPVPRELFTRRRADKGTEEYVRAATPLPMNSKDIDPKEPHAEYRQWKKEMAEMRRTNLRQGLKALHKRKKQTDWIIEQQSREKQQRRARVLKQGEPEDVLLTRPSVIREMLPQHNPVLPDPDRQQRLALSKGRLEQRSQQKELARRDSLHTLYMNARDFIVNEQQLAAAIDKAFPDGINEAWRNDQTNGENIWNLGFPMNVSDALTRGTRTDADRWDKVQERVKKLGEEITGGKL